MDAFSILFTNEMFENIVQHVNKRIANALEKLWDLKRQFDSCDFCDHTCVCL